MRIRQTSGRVAVAIALLTACRQAPKKSVEGGPLRPLNVVLVTIDTLRADRIGCYGYRQAETPNLDRLAQRAALFENAVAQAPLTTPSHASMMTGLLPTRHKVRDTGGFQLSASYPTLATILQRQGWDTAAFVGSAVLKKRFGLGQGFAVYDDEMPVGGAERRAAEVVDRAVRWLDAQTGKPFLLWVHVYDPHLPYDPPGPFRDKYKERPYDGEVAYADRELGRLFEAVAKKAPLEKTIVAALSDHGEGFSEHGEYAHGVFLYDTTLRIPFLLAGPNVPPNIRVRQQATTVDLLPTLLELMGGRPPEPVQGSSLVPAFSGKESDAYTYLETMFPRLNMGWSELRGIRTNRWKYVRAPKPELYDLANDPGEAHNLAATHATILKDLEARIGTEGAANEKIEPAAVDPRTLQQLKSLGYLGGASTTGQVLDGAGADPKDRTDIIKLLYQGMYSNLPLARRIDVLKKAVAADPVNPALYSNLGDLYAQGARHREAMELYQSAIQHGIRTAWLFSRMGQLCLRQGKKNDSIPFFEAAAQLNPNDYESLQNLSVAYRETGRIDEAQGMLELILKSGEPFAPAYNELGMVWYQKGDRAKALGYFEKAAALDPTYQLNLGRIYKAQGDTTRARVAFEAFLAAKGGSPEYRQIMPQVRRELAAIQ